MKYNITTKNGEVVGSFERVNGKIRNFRLTNVPMTPAQNAALTRKRKKAAKKAWETRRASADRKSR